eukprot:CAMPEP_0172466372 /NCGR_PEP_ID=MMETSP1065-20121228/55939_1 /TAXON_ID=265537 /ORGANISM="Amphiprora paludosa, Strain CCMP125" /LENGTH=85 /DNA_ID=CAMNT_0013223151 /DNA_START=59 /DNA_END=313 /DNA_ORIENTATION=+
MATSPALAAQVRHVYRELMFMAKHMPKESQRNKALTELRTAFRDTKSEESIEDRLKKAEARMSFLRITTPQTRRRRNHGDGSGTW